MATKLFVGGLSWNKTDERLRNGFSQIGEVASASVIKDRYSGKSKGFGFVEMTKDEDAKKAIEQLNGTELDGRQIAVNEARPQVPRSPRQDSSKKDFDRGGRNW